MISLAALGIVKQFGPVPTLAGVTLEVRPGDKIALVGPNGAGKTTLLHILAGRLEADAGRVEKHASCRLEYLEQQPEWTPGRTLWDEARGALDELLSLVKEAEEAAEALAKSSDPLEHKRLGQKYDRLQHELEQREAYHVDRKLERVLDGLGFSRASFSQSVESLSGGQRNRLMLAKLLLRDPDVMLLDEPSNHLDIEATEWLETYLSQSSQALVVVSHDRYFLDKVATRVVELYRGETEEYTGNFTAYLRQKAERLKTQTQTYERQQEQIAKAEEFIRRNHYGQKSAQAKDREKKLARVERVAEPREIAAPAMGFAPADRTGDIVLRADGLAKAYARPLFVDLSFQIERGQRWGILGPNGAGKTTLLRCLLAEETPDAGSVSLGTGVRVGYYDQLLSGIDPELPVVEAVRPPGKEFDEPTRRKLLARYGLQGDQVFQKVSSLSGGEKGRAALARLAARDANFLVLDEPTNHLDLWACDSLERSILRFEGTVLFVSHDRYFLNRVADRLLIVEPDRFRVLEGNYDTYLHLVGKGMAGGATSVAALTKPTGTNVSATKPSRPESTGKSKRRFPYRKLEDIEAEIFQRESRIEELQLALSSPEALCSGDRAREIQAEVASHQHALPTLYEHWEEASRLN